MTDFQGFMKPLDLSNIENPPPKEPVPVYEGDSDPKGMRAITVDETHIWSFDYTLAAILDIGLTMIGNCPWEVPLEGQERARDIFRRYATKDDKDRFDDEDWKHYMDADSDAYKDLMWALDWLRDNFTALWT